MKTGRLAVGTEPQRTASQTPSLVAKTLPTEIKQSIAKNLDLETLYKVSQLDRSWRAALSDPTFLNGALAQRKVQIIIPKATVKQSEEQLTAASWQTTARMVQRDLNYELGYYNASILSEPSPQEDGLFTMFTPSRLWASDNGLIVSRRCDFHANGNFLSNIYYNYAYGRSSRGLLAFPPQEERSYIIEDRAKAWLQFNGPSCDIHILFSDDQPAIQKKLDLRGRQVRQARLSDNYEKLAIFDGISLFIWPLCEGDQAGIKIFDISFIPMAHGQITDTGFSSDGHIFFSGCRRGCYDYIFWQTTDVTPHLISSSGSIDGINFSNHYAAVSHTREGYVSLRSLNEQQLLPLQRLVGHSKNPRVSKFSADGLRLAVAHEDGCVDIWNLRNKKQTYITLNLKVYPASPDICFSVDNRYLNVVNGRTVKVLDFDTKSQSRNTQDEPGLSTFIWNAKYSFDNYIFRFLDKAFAL